MLKNPIFLALDVDDVETARRLARDVGEHVGGFKVGPRLCLRYGPQLVKELAQIRPVFVDNKYFDIPNTIVSAVKATYEAGASFATVHAQSGGQALAALAKLEQELNQTRPFKILAVTILTSFSQQGLPKVSQSMPIEEQVKSLATLTLESGLSGLVCSSEEVHALRKAFPGAYLVVPGIRLPGGDKGDQKRIADPATAMRAGASALVVGRPIVEAKDPRQSAAEFLRLATI